MTAKPTPITDDQTVADVQIKLRELGYVATGPVDGDLVPKGKTEAAILDIRNNLGLPLTPTIDAKLIEAIKTAPPKTIPPLQASATVADIAPKVEAVKQTRWAKFWAKVAAYPSLILAGLLAIADHFGEAVEKLAPLKNFASEVPGWVWIGGAGMVATLIAFNMNKAEDAMKKGYQEGTVTDDKKEVTPS